MVSSICDRIKRFVLRVASGVRGMGDLVFGIGELAGCMRPVAMHHIDIGKVSRSF